MAGELVASRIPPLATGRARTSALLITAAVLAGLLPEAVDLKLLVAVLGAAAMLALAVFRLRAAVLAAVALAPFTNLIGSWLHLGNASVGGMLRDAALAVVVLLWLLQVLREHRRVPLSPARVALVAYAALVVFLAILSHDHLSALFGARNLIFNSTLLFVAADLFRDRKSRLLATRVMVASLTVLSLIGVAEVATNGAALDRIGFSPSYGGQTGSRAEIGNTFLGRRRATGGVANPLDFGWLAMIGFFLALSWRPATARDRWLRRLALAACSLGIVGSIARSAWLGLVVGLVAMTLAAGERRALRALLAAAAAVGLLFAVFPQAVYFEHLLARDVASRTTIEGRLAIYRYATRFVAANPLGVGIGTQGSANRRTTDIQRFTQDSYYLELAGEGGPMLAAAFLALISILFLEVRRRTRPATPEDIRTLAVGCVGVLAAAAAASITSASLDSRIISIEFWFLIGLALSHAPGLGPLGGARDA